MGHFSVFGHRTPHLEGRPGTHARVLAELNSRFENLEHDDDARCVLKHICAPLCEEHGSVKNIRATSPDSDSTDSELSFNASVL
jgi:hypothetical protein